MIEGTYGKNKNSEHDVEDPLDHSVMTDEEFGRRLMLLTPREVAAVDRLMTSWPNSVPAYRLVRRSRKRKSAPTEDRGDWLNPDRVATVISRIRDKLGEDSVEYVCNSENIQMYRASGPIMLMIDAQRTLSEELSLIAATAISTTDVPQYKRQKTHRRTANKSLVQKPLETVTESSQDAHTLQEPHQMSSDKRESVSKRLYNRSYSVWTYILIIITASIIMMQTCGVG